MEKNVDTIGRRFNGSAKRRAAANASLNISKRHASNLKRVTSLLRKKKRASRPLTKEEEEFLFTNSELVKQFYKRREKRAELLRRQKELEDSPKELNEKCLKLAQAIHDAEFLIVYTGAGISTAASIPDYRGPNGIWTRLQKGKDIGHHDLTAAEPTYTHMALAYLHSRGIVRHVVSQNCDGLHLRSGLPKTSLSEVHGNMYIEVCKHCVPAREYVRTFDVTEKTSTFNHTTGRRCYRCGEPLIDTIVHFGERGRLRWPLNWQGACQAAKACDTILCLGSSLKVLRKYPWLWQMNRHQKRRPHLYVVNLQWTPKDKDATIKINGKCDDVIKVVMKHLGFEVPHYVKADDPIFQIFTPLHTDEGVTVHRPLLKHPDSHHLNSPNHYAVGKKKRGRRSHPPFSSVNDRIPAFSESGLSETFDFPANGDILFNFFPLVQENGAPKEFKLKEEFKDVKLEGKITNTVKSDLDLKVEEGGGSNAVVKEEEVEGDSSNIGVRNLVGESLKVKEEVKLESGEMCLNVKEEVKLESGEDGHGSLEGTFRGSLSSLSDSESTDFPKAEQGVLTRALSLPLLSSLNNKEINFYGTGLCIRSSAQPIDQTSNEDEDEDDDFDDMSFSSMTSDTKSEGANDPKKESSVGEGDGNVDFLFLSDDSSDAVVISVESDHFDGQNQVSSRTNFSKHPAPFGQTKASPLNPDDTHENEEGDSNDRAQFSSSPSGPSGPVDETSIDAGPLEHCPTSRDKRLELVSPMADEETGMLSSDYISGQTRMEEEFKALFSDSGSVSVQRDGSYLLQTKIIDGVIHAATVKALNEVHDEENLNGGSSPIYQPSPPMRKRKSFPSTKPPIGEKTKTSLELDDDVKRLWFWGFDTRAKKDGAVVPAAVVEPQQRRLTRSSYQKVRLSQPSLDCPCMVANPGLCRLSVPRPEDPSYPEEEMVRAREGVRKRRQYNYRRFEPVFEVALKSLIYERKKMRRSKWEKTDEDEEEEKKELEDEGRVDVTKKIDTDCKVVPGWYGKGYRKVIRKKKASVS